MATLKDATTGNKQRVDANVAARVSILPPFVDDASGGRYRWIGRTGLLTGVAADGLLFALRNNSTTKLIVLDFLRLAFVVDVDFTTRQRVQFYARVLRAITVVPTAGGGAVDLTLNKGKTRTSQQASLLALTGAYLATTAVITGGTLTTEDPDPFALVHGHAPDAGATIQNLPVASDFDARKSGPQVLVQNEGIAIRNGVALGAAGTVQLAIEIAWREITIADAAGL